MDEKNTAQNEEQHYSALGESMVDGQGLPPDALPTPAGEPVRETPVPGDPIASSGGKTPSPKKASAKTPVKPKKTSAGADTVLEASAEKALVGAENAAPVAVVPVESENTEDAEKTEAQKTEKTKKDPTQSFIYKLTNSPLWQPILRPIMALVVICLVTSLLLGLTNALTEPVITANAARDAEAARVALLPQADGFEAISVPADLTTVTAIYRATNGAGWVVEAYGRGYGGKVPALVAFTENGDIAGVTFAENTETVGLGQKVREPAFYEQFTGRSAQNLSLADIDKIASATISSNAALSAVNAAIEAFQRETGGGSAIPASLEEALPSLLPDETLTALTLPEMPGVQAAYRGSAGNFIIVGTAASSNPNSSQLIVAAVAVTPEGGILNLWLDTSGENYGAALATDTAFLGSFTGQTAPVQVDVVAGVTGSSTSVITAVNTALGALPLAKEAT